MKTFINFWKKDVINKLTVILGAVLVAGGIAFVYVVAAALRMPNVQKALFPQAGGIPTVVPVEATATREPTPTTAFFAPTTDLVLPTLSPTDEGTTANLASPTLAAAALASPTTVALSAACIPDHPKETGTVLEVLDGNTARVYTKGKVYIVRYIGIAVPRGGENKQPYGDAATFQNSKLVFGKAVTLVADVSDKDAAGRLLRYVIAGDTFVNLELIRVGMATADKVPPDTACSDVFESQEQAARQAQVGRWVGTPTPTPLVP